MPILDASILDTDPEGTRRLRDVLGPACREPPGRAAMRAAAERQQRPGSERTERQRESDAALARAIRQCDAADDPAQRFHRFG